MIVSWLILPAVMLTLSAGCGLAVARAAGDGLARPLVLPVGFAAMIVIASAATASGGTAELAAPLVLALAVTGFLVASDRRAWIPDGWAIAACLGVCAVYAAPVVLSGAETFTGYIQLDDIATWLAMTDLAMDSGRDFGALAPSSYKAALQSYLPGGYPIGAFLPLGLGHEFTLGHDIAWLFAPTMALTAGLLALTLTSIVAPLLSRPWARAFVAFVAAQSALLVSYAGWGAIKEVTAAMLVALIAALTPSLGEPVRRVLPLAVAVAALVAALSLGGGVWVAPVVLAAVLASRPRPRALLRSVPALTVAFALLSIPSLILAKGFIAPQVKSGSVLTAITELGNLKAPLPSRHLLGIWPAGDFRVTPDQEALTNLLLLVVAVAAVAGLVLAAQRRAGALAGYFVGGLVGCALLISRGSPWVDGKAMATAAPIVLTAGLAALAWVATERTGREARGLALAGLGVLAAGVVWSNVLGYASSYVAPARQLSELKQAGDTLAGQGPTLMTEYEPYGARHFLRRADGEGASELRIRLIPLRDGTQLPKSAAADITAFDPTALREYRSLVLRTGPLGSRPPSAYERMREGVSYDIWQRPTAPPPQPIADLPLGGDADPAARPRCAAVRRLARQAGPNGRLVAVERAAPTLLSLATARLSGGLQPDANPRFAVPMDDGTLTAAVTVPTGGEYRVWLGGSTRGTTTVRVDGRQTAAVQGQLNNQGGMMRFGRIRLAKGTHRIELTYDDDGLTPGQRGQQSLGLPFGPLVLAPREPALTPFSVPSGRAEELCGRRLDWIEAHTR